MRPRHSSKLSLASVAAALAILASSGESHAAAVDVDFTELLSGDVMLPATGVYTFNSAIAPLASQGFSAPVYRSGAAAIRFDASVFEGPTRRDLGGYFVARPPASAPATIYEHRFALPNDPQAASPTYQNFAFDGSYTSFAATDFVAGIRRGGVYTNNTGFAIIDDSLATRPAALHTTPLPAASNKRVGNHASYNIDFLGDVTAENGAVAFDFSGTANLTQGGTISNFNAIYVWSSVDPLNASYTKVVESFDPVPDGSGDGFRDFNLGRATMAMDDGDVVFVGRRSNSGVTAQGVYTNIDGTLSVVADTSNAALNALVTDPDRALSFFDVTTSIDNGLVAFVARDQNTNPGALITETIAVVADLGNGLELLATRSTEIPDIGGFFTSFGEAALSGDTVVFLGEGNGGYQGIFAEIGGSLHNLVDTTDLLDGKTIAALRFDSEGLEGSEFAFTAVFGDGTQSVYSASFALAAVPEPPVQAIFLAGLALLFAGRLRSRLAV